MRAVNIAIDVLDHLDPILGYDLKNILEEPGDDPRQAICDVLTQCQCRKVILRDGPLKQLWDCAIEALDLAIERIPAC
jgi:hypothetical protein